MEISLLIPFLLFVQQALAQDVDGTKVLELNKEIDQRVVEKDIASLKLYYADDFVFTHGTGKVDSKDSWLQSVANSNSSFVSRTHDSTQVEMHNDVAIVTGSLAIHRQGKDNSAKYGIRYVRVYAKKQRQWQLISHRTVKEWHF